MTQSKTIIVTGSNKGLGFGIVQSLVKNPHIKIIMACRDIDKGNQAKNKILSKHKDAQIQVEKLDISDSKSIDEFISKLKKQNIQVDVLMNNAGVAAKKSQWGIHIFDFTYKTNFYGTIELTQKILPLLKNNGKIVTMGSSSGRNAYKIMKSQDLRKMFKCQKLSKEQLIQLMRQFKQRVQDDTYEQKGWPKSIYGMSKLGINLYCSILSKKSQILKRGIQVYSCCPGYVKTDMTGGKGDIDVEQGIKTAVHLIQIPFEINSKQQGGFFQKCQLSSTFEEVH